MTTGIINSSTLAPLLNLNLSSSQPHRSSIIPLTVTTPTSTSSSASAGSSSPASLQPQPHPSWNSSPSGTLPSPPSPTVCSHPLKTSPQQSPRLGISSNLHSLPLKQERGSISPFDTLHAYCPEWTSVSRSSLPPPLCASSHPPPRKKARTLTSCGSSAMRSTLTSSYHQPDAQPEPHLDSSQLNLHSLCRSDHPPYPLHPPSLDDDDSHPDDQSRYPPHSPFDDRSNNNRALKNTSQFLSCLFFHFLPHFLPEWSFSSTSDDQNVRHKIALLNVPSENGKTVM